MIDLMVVNSRGRILLRVTAEHALTTEQAARLRMPAGVNKLYSYTGDGIGGCATAADLMRTIAAIRADSPSARVVTA